MDTSGVRVIKITGQYDNPDDPSLPFLLEVALSAPEFMNVAFVLRFGGIEEVIARAATAEELTAWLDEHKVSSHPRLLRWSITGPDSKVVESFTR